MNCSKQTARIGISGIAVQQPLVGRWWNVSKLITMVTLGRKTGPKPRFHIEDVIHAAIELGIDKFSLADIARMLNVSTPSLYRVVSTRDELVHLCLATAAKDLALPAQKLSWQQQLRIYVDEFWNLAERYPGLTKAIIETPGAHIHVQSYFQAISESLAAADFPGDAKRIDFVLDFLGDTVLMTHLQISILRTPNADGLTGTDIAKRIFDQAAAHSTTPLHMRPDDSWSHRGYLDDKVEFIIQGLESGLPR